MVLSTSTLVAFAEPTETYGGYVVDLADILLPEEEDKLLAEADKLSKKHEIDIGILTQRDIGMDTESYDYIEHFYNSNLNTEHTNIVLFIGFDELGRYAQVDSFNVTDGRVDNSELLDIREAIQSGSDSKSYADRLMTGLEKTNFVIKLPKAADFAILGFFPISMVGLIVGLILSIIITIALVIKHNRANKQILATAYLNQGGIDIIDKRDRYIRTDRDVHRGYYKKSSSSGGGGGGGHSSSGGGRF